MTLFNVPVHEQVPPPSMDSVEESSILPENQHSPSAYVADVEENVPLINMLPTLAISGKNGYHSKGHQKNDRDERQTLGKALTSPWWCKTWHCSHAPSSARQRPHVERKWDERRRVITPQSSPSFTLNPLRNLDSLFLFAVSRPIQKCVPLSIWMSRYWRTSSSKGIEKEIEYCTCLLSTSLTGT